MNKRNKDNEKILLASLAGISAGIVAGLLLAPEDGRSSRENVKQSLNDAGDEINRTIKRWTANIKAKYGQGKANEDDELVMQGSWDDVKGQLKKNYDDITE
jgi:gas vesicle protein